MTTRGNWLENRIPPPLVALAFLLGMVVIARLVPQAGFAFAGSLVVAAAGALAGLAIILAAVIGFRRRATTVDPLHPERASALVADGIYRITRNPMYLGMALILLGAQFWLGNVATLLGPLGFVLWINRFQIAPEERALASTFGESFTAYCRQVRRWL